MSQHFIEVCARGHVLSQCRCPGPNKTMRVRPGVCVCRPGAHMIGAALLLEPVAPDPAPTITVPRAVLENALREAWRAGNGSRLHRDDRETSSEEVYIARAMSELEQA